MAIFQDSLGYPAPER